MPSSAAVVIDLDVPGPTISRHLYGHFAEHLGRCIYGGFWVGEDSEVPNEGGIRSDVVQALRDLDIPNLRWPGGCFADDYHWRDGIGPREQRPSMVNSHWGDVVEDNSFGTHEFMALCELLGADPYVSGNVGSGTVREMSEWVEYLTRADASPMASLRRANGRDEPWRVPFWGLGNEAWGCGGHMRAETYADLARQYATYCRDHGDHTLYRIAAGAADDDLAWTEALMKAIGGLGCRLSPRTRYQAVSFHYYTHADDSIGHSPATTFSEDQWYGTVRKSLDVERVIRGHSAVMDAYDPERRIGLVCDEWGTWWKVEDGTNPGFLYQQNTVRDALVASTHFDVFHRHAERLVMANIAQTVNVLQSVLLTDPDTGALVLTPTYHVFEMNRGHHDATALPTHVLRAPTRGVPHPDQGEQEIPLLSVSASRHEQSALVSLSNLSYDEATTVSVDLRGPGFSVARARLLTADDPAAHNTPQAPGAVAPRAFDPEVRGTTLQVELPAHSFATVELTLA